MGSGRAGEYRFPGCSAARFVDAHHVHHWADGRSRGNVHAIRDANGENGLEITPGTAVRRWDGERMDDSLAVLALIRRE